MLTTKKQVYALRINITILLLIAAVSLFFNSTRVDALQITNRSISLSSYDINAANVTHTISFELKTAVSTESLVFEYCANSPLIGQSCTVPAGLDVSSAALTAESGETGFSVHPDTALGTNRIILTRLPTVVTAQPVSYSMNGITNPSLTQTYFVRVTSHASPNGSGAYIDYGGMAFHTSEDYSVQLYVPPSLEFCVGVTISGDCATASGNSLNLGDFSPSNPSSATSQFRANTNAENGYTVSVSGTTLTSGNNLVSAINSHASSAPGTNQYGINLADNNLPNVGQNPIGPGSASVDPDYNQVNLFQFISGDTITSSSGTSDNVTFTVSYLVNIADSQPPGVYSTTMSYLCLATF